MCFLLLRCRIGFVGGFDRDRNLDLRDHTAAIQVNC